MKHVRHVLTDTSENLSLICIQGSSLWQILPFHLLLPLRGNSFGPSFDLLNDQLIILHLFSLPGHLAVSVCLAERAQWLSRYWQSRGWSSSTCFVVRFIFHTLLLSDFSRWHLLTLGTPPFSPFLLSPTCYTGTLGVCCMKNGGDRDSVQREACQNSSQHLPAKKKPQPKHFNSVKMI